MSKPSDKTRYGPKPPVVENSTAEFIDQLTRERDHANQRARLFRSDVEAVRIERDTLRAEVEDWKALAKRVGKDVETARSQLSSLTAEKDMYRRDAIYCEAANHYLGESNKALTAALEDERRRWCQAYEGHTDLTMRQVYEETRAALSSITTPQEDSQPVSPSTKSESPESDYPLGPLG